MGSATAEAELRDCMSYLAGTEWSRPVGGAVPYARVSVEDTSDGTGAYGPWAG